MPYFSVVLATYNRGVHILPTLRSVLAQTFRDFELLVIGDHCTDDTEAILQPFLGEQVKWFNLAERGGSQSFPNNAGIECAGGDFVAYIGHDDLWAADHLERLAELFRSGIDFGVSGCICHPPPGVRDWPVLGLFDDEQAKFEHFFPASSFGHSRRAALAIGGWRSGKAPVEADLLLRAAAAGLTFASTGEVTVHRFVVGDRYLANVRPASDEQIDMLERMRQPGFEESVAAIVEASKRAGSYMSLRHPSYGHSAKGNIGPGDAFGRASMGPAPQPLQGWTLISQTNEPRGLDWKLFDPGETRFRWSHLNPRPKILIPFTSRFPVHFRLQVAHRNAEVLKALRVELNGVRARMRIERLHHNGTLWEATAEMISRLSETGYSIVSIILPDAALGGGDAAGIAVAELALDPLPADAEPPTTEFEEGQSRLSSAVNREKAMIRKAFADQAAARDRRLQERAAERARLEAERSADRAALEAGWAAARATTAAEWDTERAAVSAERDAAAEQAAIRARRETESLAEIDELTRRLACLTSTLSWRLTAPFRELRGLPAKVVRQLLRRGS